MDVVNTTDNSNDSEDRVATIILSPDRSTFLIGHAPNRSFKKDNQWDIVGKGHIEYGDKPIESAIRETLEESNIDISGLPTTIIDTVKYKTGHMTIVAVVLPEMSVEIICKSVFDCFGKQLPEFSVFKWITFAEAETHLYRGLYQTLTNASIFEKIENQLKNGLL